MFNEVVCAALMSLAVGMAGSVSVADQAGAATEPNGKTGSEQSACDAKKVVGRWSGDRYSMEILGDGAYRASGTPNMASIDVTGTFKTESCRATIVDTSGQYACPSAEIGEYTFAVTDSTLKFTLVKDACEGRRTPLGRGPLTRMKSSR